MQSRLGYSFKDIDLLNQALSHRSVDGLNNERLEFLGDAFLGVIIGEALFNKFEHAKEGQLTQIRSNLVKGETLASIARDFNLGDHLLLGQGELKSGGHRRSSILEDAMEAIIGAIYIDAGESFAKCRSVVLGWYSSRLDAIKISDSSKDSKTKLQEVLQERGLSLPRYSVVQESGEAHSKHFTVQCFVANLDKATLGEGSSKRAAEKQAAQAFLLIL